MHPAVSKVGKQNPQGERLDDTAPQTKKENPQTPSCSGIKENVFFRRKKLFVTDISGAHTAHRGTDSFLQEYVTGAGCGYLG